MPVLVTWPRTIDHWQWGGERTWGDEFSKRTPGRKPTPHCRGGHAASTLPNDLPPIPKDKHSYLLQNYYSSNSKALLVKTQEIFGNIIGCLMNVYALGWMDMHHLELKLDTLTTGFIIPIPICEMTRQSIFTKALWSKHFIYWPLSVTKHYSM